MKFRRSEREKHRVRANVDLTPLIDVVFQLLIFFMLTATFVVQSSIPIDMPEADGESELEPKSLSITLAPGKDGVEGGGKIFINSEEVRSFRDLTIQLEQELEMNPGIMVILRPDASVETRRLVRVLGIASRIVGDEQRIGIAVEPIMEQE